MILLQTVQLEVQYLFRHALVQEAAYPTLLTHYWLGRAARLASTLGYL